MLKIRPSRDRLIINMGIPILVRRHLSIATAPWFCDGACAIGPVPHCSWLMYLCYSAFLGCSGGVLMDRFVCDNRFSIAWKIFMPTSYTRHISLTDMLICGSTQTTLVGLTMYATADSGLPF